MLACKNDENTGPVNREGSCLGITPKRDNRFPDNAFTIWMIHIKSTNAAASCAWLIKRSRKLERLVTIFMGHGKCRWVQTPKLI